MSAMEEEYTGSTFPEDPLEAGFQGRRSSRGDVSSRGDSRSPQSISRGMLLNLPQTSPPASVRSMPGEESASRMSWFLSRPRGQRGVAASSQQGGQAQGISGFDDLSTAQLRRGEMASSPSRSSSRTLPTSARTSVPQAGGSGMPWTSEGSPLKGRREASPKSRSNCCRRWCGLLLPLLPVLLVVGLFTAWALGDGRSAIPRGMAWVRSRLGGSGGSGDSSDNSADIAERQSSEEPPKTEKATPAPTRVSATPAELKVCSVGAKNWSGKRHKLWNADPLMRQVCETKNAKDNWWQYNRGRDWCWLGLKSQCHADLKGHRSWQNITAWGVAEGKIPLPRISLFEPIENPQVCDRPYHGAARRWSLMERAQAREWFRNHCAVYVLGLKSATKRWETTRARLEELGIWATHINGVDMRVDGILEQAKAQGWVPKTWNQSFAQVVAYDDKQKFGPLLGTLGCASAHFKAHQKILSDGSPLAIVLEDDVVVEDDFVERVWSLVLEELPCDWEVTSLYSRCPYGTCVSKHLMRVQPDFAEPFWRCRQGVNWGMQGILYRTDRLRGFQNRWAETVFDEQRPHCLDVDVALASISDEVAYYAVPSVQEPGFLREMDGGSARWDINQDSDTTKPPSPSTPHEDDDTGRGGGGQQPQLAG